MKKINHLIILFLFVFGTAFGQNADTIKQVTDTIKKVTQQKKPVKRPGVKKDAPKDSAIEKEAEEKEVQETPNKDNKAEVTDATKEKAKESTQK